MGQTSQLNTALRVAVANPGVVIDTGAGMLTATLTITNDGPAPLSNYAPLGLSVGNTQGVSSTYPCNLAPGAPATLDVAASVTCTVSVANFNLNLQSKGLAGVAAIVGQTGSGGLCFADLKGAGAVVLQQAQAPAVPSPSPAAAAPQQQAPTAPAGTPVTMTPVAAITTGAAATTTGSTTTTSGLVVFKHPRGFGPFFGGRH